MGQQKGKEIIQSYIDAFNKKNYDEFTKYTTENFVFQSFLNGELDWERKGIDSLNDHAENVILKVIPDWEIIELKDYICTEDQIWFMIISSGTFTGKMEIEGYLDSFREPTFQRFKTLHTYIFKLESGKVATIKSFIDFMDPLMKLRVIKYVDESDTVNDYIKMILSQGLLGPS